MQSDPVLTERFSHPAIAHEWLTVPGGSEKVVLELLELLPRAEIFTSVYDPGAWPPAIAERPVHTSFLNRIPGAARHYPKLLPLMNRAFESFDLSAYDLVISSHHSCAKSVITRSDALHVCYCHTPMRHAWEPGFLEGELSGPALAAARLLMPRIRRQDLAAAARPDVFVANSRHVAARIRKYYRRDARVIHPPVDVDAHLRRPRAPEDWYLVLGRLVPYKRAEVAVAACASLGRPVKVAGDGRAVDSARAVAGPGAEFLGRVSDDELGDLLSRCRALLFPGEEDFGIVPVEAQAAGVPVIAYGVGGILDSVVDGETGLFCAEQTPQSLAAAILAFEEATLDETAIRDNARRFGPERFRAQMADLIEEYAREKAAA